MAVFVRLFGGVFLNDREPLHFRTQATGSLFAFLAYHAGKPHTRDILVETFWPGRAPHAGRNSLSLALSSLRRLLQNIGIPPNAALLADRSMVCLSDAHLSTDVMIFEALLHAGLWHGSPTSAGGEEQTETQQGQLREAIALYRGPLLESVCDDSEWILGERARLHGRYEAALHHLARLREAQGDWDDALNLCFQAVQAAPFSEEAQTRLIGTCLRAGRPSLAVQQYDKYALLLQNESGDTPPELLQTLLAPYRTMNGPVVKLLKPPNTGRTKKHLSQSAKPNAAFQIPTPYDAWESEANAAFPLASSLFCGRHEEINHLISVLPRLSQAAPAAADTPCRMVILLGMCGIGKTRLAAETVRAALSASPVPPRKTGQKETGEKRRVFFVPPPHAWGRPAENEENPFGFVLAQVLGGNAPVIGMNDAAGRNLDRLEEALVKRLQLPTLLVLDSLDEVIARDKNALPLLCRLLHRITQLSCLVTARTRFELPKDDGISANTTPSVGSDQRKSPPQTLDVYEYWVPPLPVPPVPPYECSTPPRSFLPAFPLILSDPNLLTQHYPSAALFAARARAAVERASVSSSAGKQPTENLGKSSRLSSGFRLTAHNCADVAVLCAKLGGVPLALEIAGAAAAFWSPKEILSRLRSEETSEEAQQGEAAALPRTIFDALQASFNLLPPAARRLLCVLGVFQGGWTADAVQCVANLPGMEQTLRLLELLKNAALIVPVMSQAQSNQRNAEETPRWDMLPPVALFIRRRFVTCAFAAGENDDFRTWSAAHARYFANFADENADFWRCEADRENLYTAIRWSVETESDPCAAREKDEVLVRFIHALGSPDCESRAACVSSSDERSGVSPHWSVAGEVEYAAQTLVQQNRLAGLNPAVCPDHLWLMASRCAFGRGDHAQAISWADEAMGRSQNKNDVGGNENGGTSVCALSRAYRGFLACWTGDTTTARKLLNGGEGKAPLSQRLFQSLTELWEGDYGAARFLARHCLAAASQSHQGEAVSAGAFFVLASAATAEATAASAAAEKADKYREAEIYLEESLSRWGFGGTAIDNAAPAALCGISGLGDKRLACLALSLRGWRFTDETTPDALRQAVRSYWQAFCLSHRIGCEENRAVALEGLGQAAWHTAEAADADKNHAFAALRLWGAAEHLQQKSGIPLRLPPVLREKAKEFHARAYEQAGRTVYDAQHFIGSVLTVPEVTRLAESVCLPPLEVT